jgi:peptidyl-prolyl cis-trans isomerase D
MSVIQKIRDKYARWAVIAIALSLLGFIMMDAFAGKGSLLNNKQSNTLGKINGRTIDATVFGKKVAAEEANESRQGQIDDARRQQIVQGLWDQEVTDIVMNAEYEKLGLTVTDKEMNEVMYGANPPQDLKQRFSDEKTGVFNAVAAKQFINQIRKSGTVEDKAGLENYINSLRNQRLMSKYTALLANTIYYPKWFAEKRNIDNSLMAKISYIAVPYTSIPDSTVKISDSEIEDFIKEHKKDFEQKYETRSISFVSFSASPSSADSMASKNQVEGMKAAFQSATDPEVFVTQQGSAYPFFNGYLSKTAIQIAAKDSVLALSKGSIYGPYLDGGNYVLAKMIDSKNLPDSVKCRHILIGTMNPQTGQPLIPDSIAKVKADSIALAIKNGASFDLMDSLYSTDEVAKKDKGVMTFSSTQIQDQNFAKEFGQFILLEGKTGDKKVVKTQFGWHYIEILEQKNIQPHYKVAYLAKEIQVSTDTDNGANNAASMFAGDSRDLNSFNTNYDKNLKGKGINKLVASDIDPMASSLNGVQGNARPFVKLVFEADKGDVIGPERIGESYLVAIVTDVNKPGTQSVNKVRPMIEPLLRNKKKGEQIVKNIGQVSSLEAVAAKLNQQIQTVDSVRFNGSNRALGYEPKILGAAFNPANKGKVIPQALAGTQGVYVVRVENVSTVPVETASIEQQTKAMEMQDRQSMQYRSPVEVLKKTAKIKDNRSKFY